MPDFNPDKESHADHKFLVMNAEKSKKEGLWIGDGKNRKFLKFSPKGRMFIKDEGIAREIQKKHPHELVVARVRDSKPADKGHNYFFGSMPEMPWKRKAREEKEGENESTT